MRCRDRRERNLFLFIGSQGLVDTEIFCMVKKLRQYFNELAKIKDDSCKNCLTTQYLSMRLQSPPFH